MKWLETILNDEKVMDKVEAIKQELPKHFIPKDKYNEQANKLQQKEEELKTTTDKMTELSNQVKTLSKSGEEATQLKEQLEKMNTDFDAFKSEAETRVVNIKKRQAIERGLMAAAANPETIDLLIEKFDLAKIELDDKDAVKEWDKHLTPVKEQRKSLFGEVRLTGDKPPSGDTPPAGTYRAQYDAALKSGNNREAIKIKQAAFAAGEKF